MEKVERNVKLLTWQNSIEYLDYDGTSYTDMDSAGKIACVVRDFYDITGGEWSTSDLLLLKAAMTAIDLSPKTQVNYGTILEEITESAPLHEKLLGGLTIPPVTDPGSLIAMTGMQKLDALHKDEGYVVDAVAGYLADARPDVTKDDIRHTLAREYMRAQAGVNMNVPVDSFDMVLDLLYNLRQASVNQIPLLTNVKMVEDTSKKNVSAKPKVEEKIQEHTDETFLKKAENLFRAYQLEEAYSCFSKLAEKGSGRAMYYLGVYAANGYMPEKVQERKAQEWWERGTESGDALSALRYALTLPGSSQKRVALIEKYKDKVLNEAWKGNTVAQYEVAKMYCFGVGVAQNENKAASLLLNAADGGLWKAACELGKCYEEGRGLPMNQQLAAEWYKQAANKGYAKAQYYLGLCYLKGIGVKANIDTCKSWWQKAIDQGDEKAKEAWDKYINNVGAVIAGIAINSLF